MKLYKTRNGEYSPKNFRLIKTRENKNLLQKDIAEKTEISIQMYRNYESMRDKPKQETKQKIAQVLKRSIKYLFPKNIESHYLEDKLSRDIYDNYQKVDSQPEISSRVNIHESIDKKNLIELIGKGLNYLKDKERKIIELRFGIKNNRAHTLEEIGGIYRVSRERIRQIESRAIKRLKHTTKPKLLKNTLLDFR